MLSLIVAMDEDGVIGLNNSIPWHLPRDLKHVKEITTGNTIIMGRKNFESIGKALPNRRNIILSRNSTLTIDDVEVFNTIEDILQAVEEDDGVFVFGGEEIYRLFLPYVSTMYVTKIHDKFDGDTYFPIIDWSEWYEVYSQPGITDDKNKHDHSYYIYERKS